MKKSPLIMFIILISYPALIKTMEITCASEDALSANAPSEKVLSLKVLAAKKVAQMLLEDDFEDPMPLGQISTKGLSPQATKTIKDVVLPMYPNIQERHHSLTFPLEPVDENKGDKKLVNSYGTNALIVTPSMKAFLQHKNDSCKYGVRIPHRYYDASFSPDGTIAAVLMSDYVLLMKGSDYFCGTRVYDINPHDLMEWSTDSSTLAMHAKDHDKKEGIEICSPKILLAQHAQQCSIIPVTCQPDKEDILSAQITKILSSQSKVIALKKNIKTQKLAWSPNNLYIARLNADSLEVYNAESETCIYTQKTYPADVDSGFFNFIPFLVAINNNKEAIVINHRKHIMNNTMQRYKPSENIKSWLINFFEYNESNYHQRLGGTLNVAAICFIPEKNAWALIGTCPLTRPGSVIQLYNAQDGTLQESFDISLSFPISLRWHSETQCFEIIGSKMIYGSVHWYYMNPLDINDTDLLRLYNHIQQQKAFKQ